MIYITQNAVENRWHALSSRFARLAAVVLVTGISSALSRENSEQAEPLAETEKRERRVIEEIWVTAQKREEVSQKVPISMSVMTSEFIAEQGITDIQQALLFTPNFHFDEGDFFSSPSCRGFAVDSRNVAFEPPCGVAVDGVAYTRAVYFSAALFDTQRVEVLRGPQGTTFGKNTTAGVVSLITKDPSDEFTGDMSIQYGQRNRRRIEAGLGGPIIPEILNFRVAGMKEELDGYIKNTTAAVRDVEKRGGDREREGFRIKLAFPDLFGSTLKLTYEQADMTTVGYNREWSSLSPTVEQWFLQHDPNADFERGNFTDSWFFPAGSTSSLDRMQVDWTYDIGEWGLDLVASRASIDFSTFGGNSADPASFASLSESNPATTFELRLASPDFSGLFGLKQLFGLNLGESDVLAGVYYQRLKLEDGDTFFRLNHYTFGGQTSAQNGVLVPPYSQTPQGMLGIPESSESANFGFDQESETTAVFARIRWHLTERWLLQLGGRLSEETKDARWETRTSDPAPVLNAIGVEDMTEQRSLRERQFQPKVTVGYAPTDDLNFFVHWTRGFKAGGFNAFVLGQNPETADRPDGLKGSLSFDPEVATEWGADAKMTLFDGKVRLNISLFRLELDDFQVLTSMPPAKTPTGDDIPGSGFIQVVNAAEARTQGVEADLLWLATDWLTLIGTVGMNDTKYVDFPINICPPDRPNTDGDDDPRCDVSGQPFPRAPKWNNTLTANLRFPLGGLMRPLGGVDFTAGTTVEYYSRQFQNERLDDRFIQSSFYRWRANIGFENPEQGWSLRLMVENLTDKLTHAREAMEPALGRAVLSHPEPPRTVYGQFRYDF